MQHNMDQTGQSPDEGGNKGWLECTVNALQMSVNSIGIKKDLRAALKNNIQKNAGQFNLAFETESAGEKLRLNLQFKNDTSDYDFAGYQVTLLHPLIIDHRNINGIETWQLENKMKTMDWYYGISETPGEVINGHKNAESIEVDLKQLSRTEEGGLIATLLWHNHVPANTVPKPDFITKVEAALDLYPERTFPSNVKLEEACDIVRGYSREVPLAQGAENFRTEFAFHEQQPGEIKQHLQQLELEGNVWVAYQDPSVPMTKDSMHGFKDVFEVMEFCYENTTDLDRYTYSSIDHIKDAVTQWNQLSEKDINLVAIEKKMAGADWQYERAAKSREQWVKGEGDMEEIQKDLVFLCKLPGGIDKANALWDKYAPNAVTKPQFLQSSNGINSGLVQTHDANIVGDQLNARFPALTNADSSAKPVQPEAASKEKKLKQRRRME
jgi:hypothetical protein